MGRPSAQRMARLFRVRDAARQASPEQLQARLELRRSNAAAPHVNRKREMTRPGKGNRQDWRHE